ncbi:MAG: hypothetical protein KF708_18520 [Pirellulales bacterium]|nr:hypothetical protein [Pirellulales bacterium]
MFRHHRSPISNRKTRVLFLSRSMLRLEPLESRWLLTASAFFSAGQLTVVGDGAANEIAITYDTVSSINYLIVTDGNIEIFDGRPMGDNVRADDVTSILALGEGGDDTIDCQDVTAANDFTEIETVYLRGGDGNDSLIGSAYDDFMAGDVGDDTLAGGAGNDLYAFIRTASEDLGVDTLVEGTGAFNDDADMLYFPAFNTGISLDLSDTSQTVASGALDLNLNADDAFEFVIGTAYSDSITGNARTNLLEGGAGDDTLAGGAGSDWYNFTGSGLGSDTIIEAGSVAGEYDILGFDGFTGGGLTIDLSCTSTQTVSLGNLSLTLSSGTGIEGVFASDDNQNDMITGNSQANLLWGGGGNDTIFGGDGRDIIAGGDGADLLDGGADDDIVISGEIDLPSNFAFIMMAIDVILTEWQSENDFEERVDNIKGIGPNPIDEDFRLIPEDTVNDTDNDADTLVGGAGDDWGMYDFGEDSASGFEETDNIGF